MRKGNTAPLTLPRPTSAPDGVWRSTSRAGVGGDGQAEIDSQISLWRTVHLRGRLLKSEHKQGRGVGSSVLMRRGRVERARGHAGTHIVEAFENGTRTSGTGGRYPAGGVTHMPPGGRAASWHATSELIGFRALNNERRKHGF